MPKPVKTLKRKLHKHQCELCFSLNHVARYCPKRTTKPKICTLCANLPWHVVGGPGSKCKACGQLYREK